MKCPGCGKKTENIFCDECRPLPELSLKELKMSICVDCKAVKIRGTWSGSQLRGAIIRYVKKALRSKLDDFELELIRHRHPRINDG